MAVGAGLSVGWDSSIATVLRIYHVHLSVWKWYTEFSIE